MHVLVTQQTFNYKSKSSHTSAKTFLYQQHLSDVIGNPGQMLCDHLFPGSPEHRRASSILFLNLANHEVAAELNLSTHTYMLVIASVCPTLYWWPSTITFQWL